MIGWQSGEVSAESIRKQEANWVVSVLKTKMQAKQMTRLDFNKLSFAWRTKYVKNGGRVVDL